MIRLTINNVNIHPAVFMMEQWQQFMDGIDRIVGFYHLEHSSSIEGLEWSNKIGQAHISPFILSNDVSAEIKTISEEKMEFQWLRPDLLPFTNKSSDSNKQLDLFSENQYLVLLVRLKAEVVEYSDLYYLFFRNDQSNFGITDSQIKLDTSHKAIIGKMATQFGKMTFSNYNKLKEKELAFKKRTKALLETKLVQNKVLKSTFYTWKKNWLVNYLSVLSQRDGVNYVMSDKVMEMIVSSELQYEAIVESIENSLVYMCELQNFTIGEEIILDESIIVLADSSDRQEIESIHPPLSRLNKTMQLLDRIENAAERLFNKGMPITSADVGLSMDKPITAPAISDALRKNKIRIFQLFEQYPERWQVIKQHFKPIINLQAKKNEYISLSS